MLLMLLICLTPLFSRALPLNEQIQALNAGLHTLCNSIDDVKKREWLFKDLYERTAFHNAFEKGLTLGVTLDQKGAITRCCPRWGDEAWYEFHDQDLIRWFKERLEGIGGDRCFLDRVHHVTLTGPITDERVREVFEVYPNVDFLHGLPHPTDTQQSIIDTKCFFRGWPLRTID